MFAQKKSSSSTVSVSFLLEIHWLRSGVQAGATKRRPTTHTQKKIIIEVYGGETSGPE